jgi:hypothetical protein
MEHPKAIGDRSTLAIMLALRNAGYDLYTPFGENTRCDLIIDDGSGLRRVQCKTGSVRAGAVKFKVCSSYAHHPNPKNRFRHYRGEIDAFAVYCRETAGIYVVPIEDLDTRTDASLRLTPPRNNQRSRVKLASQYLVATVSFDHAGAKVRRAGELRRGLLSPVPRAPLGPSRSPR